MMNTLLPVDEHVRRRNSRAVAERGRWRRQYADLIMEIKAAKHGVRLDPVGRAPKVRLRALQQSAQIMMIDRELIAMDLQDSAYRWV